jgi:hypothetical protein
MTTTQTTDRVPVNFWGENAYGPQQNRWDANQRRAEKAGYEPCTRCGRGVKPGSGFVVTVIDGGARFAPTDTPADENDSGFMGAWVIGPECGKSIPVTHKTIYAGWE